MGVHRHSRLASWRGGCWSAGNGAGRAGCARLRRHGTLVIGHLGQAVHQQISLDIAHLDVDAHGQVAQLRREPDVGRQPPAIGDGLMRVHMHAWHIARLGVQDLVADDFKQHVLNPLEGHHRHLDLMPGTEVLGMQDIVVGQLNQEACGVLGQQQLLDLLRVLVVLGFVDQVDDGSIVLYGRINRQEE